MSGSRNRRIVVFGGKPVSGRCLERLAALRAGGEAELLGLVTRAAGEGGWWSGPGVEEARDVAARLDVPLLTEDEAARAGADLGVSLLYHRILPPAVLRGFRRGIVNFHPAPLPHFRGSNAASHALLRGDARFGVSLHWMDEGVDTGDVIDVRWFPVAPADTARTLTLRAEDAIERAFVDWLPALLAGELPATPQAALRERLGVRGAYNSRRSLDALREVDTAAPPEQVWNQVRALDFPPFEPAYLRVAGRKVYLRTSY